MEINCSDRVSQHVVLSCAAVTDPAMHSCVEHNKLRTLGCFWNVLMSLRPVHRDACRDQPLSAASTQLCHWVFCCSFTTRVSVLSTHETSVGTDLESVLHTVWGKVKRWSLHLYLIFTLNTDAATAQRVYTSAEAAAQFVIVLIIEDVYKCSSENWIHIRISSDCLTFFILTVIYFSHFS